MWWGGNNGIVQYCYITSNVTSSSADEVGGVVGMNNNLLKNSYSTGTVSSGGLYVGGVAGWNSGTVQNCYSTGSTFTGDDRVGGIVGENTGGTVQNCVALGIGDITTNVGVSGDAGWIASNYSGTLINNFSRAGSINGWGLPAMGSNLAGLNGFFITSTEWQNISWWQSAAPTGPAFTDPWWTSARLPLTLP